MTKINEALDQMEQALQDGCVVQVDVLFKSGKDERIYIDLGSDFDYKNSSPFSITSAAYDMLTNGAIELTTGACYRVGVEDGTRIRVSRIQSSTSQPESTAKNG